MEIVLDVEARHTHVLRQGYPLETPLKRRPCGLTDFRLFDPDGYYL
ncbi:MAG: hypothetical protein M1296_04055 [Chloroflexi bacterium]|nr:hypothetical protein [Chloroflexota bacterium]